MQSANEPRRYRLQKKKQTAYVAHTAAPAAQEGWMACGRRWMWTSLDVDISFRRFKLTFIDVANRTADFASVNIICRAKDVGGT
jgi:hypothetical protein